MKWTSPGILAFAYYKGYITQDYFHAYCKLFTVFGSLLFATYLARGICLVNIVNFVSYLIGFGCLCLIELLILTI